MSNATKSLNDVYEELRCNGITEPDTRRRIDTCEAVTMEILERDGYYPHPESDKDQEFGK